MINNGQFAWQRSCYRKSTCHQSLDIIIFNITETSQSKFFTKMQHYKKKSFSIFTGFHPQLPSLKGSASDPIWFPHKASMKMRLPNNLKQISQKHSNHWAMQGYRRPNCKTLARSAYPNRFITKIFHHLRTYIHQKLQYQIDEIVSCCKILMECLTGFKKKF